MIFPATVLIRFLLPLLLLLVGQNLLLIQKRPLATADFETNGTLFEYINPFDSGQGNAQYEDVLVLVQAVWRHGDRSPDYACKQYPNQEDAWPQGWGQLLPEGARQMVALGDRMRKRYIDYAHFLSRAYDSKQIYVRSTDWNRTLLSAAANMYGFYPTSLDGGKNVPAGQYPGLPVVPVHTVDFAREQIAAGSNCSRQKALIKLIENTTTFRYFMGTDKAQEFLACLYANCGEQVLWTNIREIYYGQYIEGRNNLTAPEWARLESFRKTLDNFTTTTTRWITGHGKLGTEMGIDFDRELARIAGGPILWTLIGNMVEKRRQLDADPDGQDPVFAWLARRRYIAYSSHGDSMSALFRGLGLPPNGAQDGYPLSASNIIVELWARRQRSSFKSPSPPPGQKTSTSATPTQAAGPGHTKFENYFVKVIYWPGITDPLEGHEIDLTGKIPTCETVKGRLQGQSGDSRLCPLDSIVRLAEPYKPVPSIQQLCATVNDVPAISAATAAGQGPAAAHITSYGGGLAASYPSSSRAPTGKATPACTGYLATPSPPAPSKHQ